MTNLLRSIAAAVFLILALVLLTPEELQTLFSADSADTSLDPASVVGGGAATEQVDGTIDRVIDGDTVDVVLGGEVKRFRLIGIDTPEVVDPRKPVQCFGQEASAHLKNMLVDQIVTIEYDASQGEIDKYGRSLGYLFLTDGTNVAEKMILDGYGYEYTYDKPYKYQNIFKIAEQDARDSERGLWSSETCGGSR